MSLENVIRSTINPVTKLDIKNGLSQLGVENAEILMVHASISSFGWIIGGSQSIIEAISEETDYHATIVMPSQSMDNSNPEEWCNPPVPKEWIQLIKDNIPAFNPFLTPMRGMGELAQVFAMNPQVIRSYHPGVSFLALGRKADWLMKNHQLDYMLGEGSPLQKLYAQDAKILCLGTTYETVTALHLAEYLTEFRSVITREAAIMVKGKREWVKYKDLDIDSDIFNEIGAAFEKNSKVKKVVIGNSECKLLDMRSLIDFATDYLLKQKG
ncbi:MAG: aminoglycoside N(3)-acetyltransferase [Turicibacter sp.]